MANISVQFPCSDGWISQKFHSGHKAIDFGWLLKHSSNGKTPVLACADGVVEVADWYPETVNGKTVKPIVCIIRHDDLDDDYTYFSAYWHLSATPKNTGDVVKAGDEIGTRGNTGYSSGVHLHFALLKCPKGMACPKSYDFDKYAIDPLPYMYRVEGQDFDGKGIYNIPLKTITVECKQCKEYEDRLEEIGELVDELNKLV